MPSKRRSEHWGGGVVEDYVDLRDIEYSPSLGPLPPSFWPKPEMFDTEGRLVFGVRSQGQRSDCVGQSLAALIDVQAWLLGADGRTAGDRVSANMLYRMAQYHEAADEIGAAAARTMSPSREAGVRSLRSAIKGFYHHGACLASVWPDDDQGRDLEWPDAAQAADAEQRFLGAYYRLSTLLNHYHAALRDSDTILVAAAVHDGWKTEEMAAEARARRVLPGTIPWNGRRGKPDDLHAFLIVGYTRNGFLVLNSWGEAWGGVEPPEDWREPAKSALASSASEKTDPGKSKPEETVPEPPLKGIGLWTYGDWAENVVDGWVMRLGVPGPDSFRYRTDEHGFRKRLMSRIAAPATSSTPQRELRGRFMNLEDGLLVRSGTYATPAAACDEFVGTMQGLVASPTTAGVILRFPGFLEPMGDGFRRAARLGKEYADHGLETANFFWSANFAEQIRELIASAVERARKVAGDETGRLDALVEASLAGIGRACWRDLVLGASHAVYQRKEPAERPGAVICGLDRAQPGKLGRAVAKIAEFCRDRKRPLHVVTEGAGALVLRDLIDLAASEGFSPGQLLDGLASVTMVFPTIPVDETDRLLAHMEALNTRAGRKAAAVLLPSRALEAQLSFCGYGKSANHLVACAFVDRGGGPLRPVLGMSLETIEARLAARFDADLARSEPGLTPKVRWARARERAAEWHRRIASVAEPIDPRRLQRGSAVAQDKRLITADEGIERIVRERLLSRKGEIESAEDRVQGASATNGDGGSHG
jgi:hypothetical protein